MLDHKAAANLGFAAGLDAAADMPLGVAVTTLYRFECFDRDGKLKWTEEARNLVVNVGLNDLLDKRFKASSYTSADYVGLIDNASFSAIAAGDTMGSHSGWLESAAYSDSTRKALTLGSVSGGSVDNSASKAAFSINGSATIKGAFITTVSTKSGTTGILYGAAAFGSTRAVESGDTLNVTCTLSVTAS